MPVEENGSNGTEEEFKASLLRQWKEGRLQVAEGRQIPTIIEHRSLRQRQSWPPLTASLPDLSQPPPGFSYIQAQPTLPLPMPSSFPLPVNLAAPQPQPVSQYSTVLPMPCLPLLSRSNPNSSETIRSNLTQPAPSSVPSACLRPQGQTH